MKEKILMLAAAAVIVPAIAVAAEPDETVPAMKVDTWTRGKPVSRTVYDRIEVNENEKSFVLQPNNGSSKSLTFNYKDHPRVSLLTVSSNEINNGQTTSIDDLDLPDNVGLVLAYNALTESLTASANVEVTVFSLGGQVVLGGRLGGINGELSVASLSAGVYIVRAYGTDSAQTLKFVKR